MQLMLRPPRYRLHPLMRRAWGTGLGDSNINPTTIWTPSTGYLNVPGDPSQGYQFKPQVTSVYDVPGLLLPAPACVQENAGAFVSAGCVDQALAIQQQNFQRTADYNAGILQLPPGAIGPGSTPPPAAAGAGRNPQLIFTNLTSGNKSSFQVGDRWQISITGAAPNQPVWVQGGQNGTVAIAQMGSTDSNGNYATNGTITADQVGSWNETWIVGGTNSGTTILQPVNQLGNLYFTVAQPAGNVAGGQRTGGPDPHVTTTATPITASNLMQQLSAPVSIAGQSIPIWAIGLAAVAALFLLKGKS